LPDLSSSLPIRAGGKGKICCDGSFLVPFSLHGDRGRVTTHTQDFFVMLALLLSKHSWEGNGEFTWLDPSLHLVLASTEVGTRNTGVVITEDFVTLILTSLAQSSLNIRSYYIKYLQAFVLFIDR
jgi:hypothetical protein